MNKFKKVLYFVLISLIIVSILYIIKYYYDIYNSRKNLSLLNEIEIKLNDNITEENNNVNFDSLYENKTERMLKIEELQKENPDIIGWIEIENTDISYPVLQCSNNSYYMNHNYKKEYSTNGSIFLDKDYNWGIPSNNLLIYGHNMKNNTMFQSLLNYKNQDYYNQHPVIRFTTNSEDVIYEIISVFESRVYYKSEQNVFRYYYFINCTNEEEYNSYIQNVKAASLYDINKSAVYGEQLMTLSTCSYHTQDGRFVVVAKKGANYIA